MICFRIYPQAKMRTMKRFSKPLNEQVTFSPGQVDRDHYVVRGVKVLGLESRNNRKYERSGVTEALERYEDAPLKTDHPKSEREARLAQSVLKTFGWLKNCRLESDGMYADAHLMRSHDFSERFMEVAERNPKVFVLSHNVDGDGYICNRTGKHIIESIPTVRSVDVVEYGRGGTNTSIFEGHEVRRTLKQTLLESKVKRTRFVARLLEMDDEFMDMPVDDMPMDDVDGDGDVDTTDAWKQDLVNAISKLVESQDSASHDLAMKILGMLKPEVAEETGFESSEETEEEPEEEVMESVKQLCSFAGMDLPPAPLLEACVAMPAKKRIAYLESLKAIGGKRRDVPRSSTRQTPTPDQPKDGPEQLKQRLSGGF